jgi:hypothetical protein
MSARNSLRRSPPNKVLIHYPLTNHMRLRFTIGGLLWLMLVVVVASLGIAIVAWEINFAESLARHRGSGSAAPAQ